MCGDWDVEQVVQAEPRMSMAGRENILGTFLMAAPERVSLVEHRSA